jgi:O-methyltransferase
MASPDTGSDSFLDTLRSERRDLLDRLRKTRFTTLKAGYSQAQIIPHSTYSPWLDDQAFIELYAEIKAFTMVDIYRCYELYSLAAQMTSVAGEVVEVGVWRGGSAALIAGANSERVIHLFDTFEGVAKADKAYDTLYAGGEHADTDQTIVRKLFQKIGVKCTINSGIFPEDTLHFLPESICFAHIDVDTYSSAKDAFIPIWHRTQPNGIVVFDDYGFFGCEGVTQFVNEITSTINDALFVHNLNGHALLIKKRMAL